MLKKIFLISLVFFGLALVIFGFHRFFFQDQEWNILRATERTSDNKNIEEADSLGTIDSTDLTENDKKISLIVDEKVESAVMAKNSSNILFYAGDKFRKVAISGESRSTIRPYVAEEEIESIQWSSNRNKVIIKTGEDFFLFTFNQDDPVKLKKGMDVVKWFSSGNKVVYKFFDPEKNIRTMDMADPDGSNWNVITDLPYKNAQLSVNPLGNKICFFPTPDANVASKKECVELQGEEKITTVLHHEGFGADYLWSPSGNKVLVSRVSQQAGNKLSLAVIDKDSQSLSELNFPATVKKCVWSKEEVFIFCSMLGGITEDLVLPNAWDRGEFFSNGDTFWRINVKDAKKERIVEIDQISAQFDATDLFLDGLEKNLFFIDRKTRGLYRIRL